ncbi:DUF4240 domain-containing protein [Actinacidiphila glaucinigra]|uniref:DUF4240 domain-containing protein n=1 Tax=Actinacidiphila glaucinigra TaxID=235986 RepID=UPI003812C6C8
MDTDRFWQLIDSARSTAAAAGEPFDEALVRLLTERPRQEILEYAERFDELHDALYRWDVWAAAHLIGGGCSDDSFIDFRAGVIAQGRDWYDRVAAAPDSLAGHPTVVAAARDGNDGALFDEDVNNVAAQAFERLTGDRDSFYTAWAAHRPAGAEAQAGPDMGEDFDFDDDTEMQRRLPRLAGLYLGPDGAWGRPV